MPLGFAKLTRGVVKGRRLGFTLIELLLVLAILGALVAVVAPYVGAGMSGTRVATTARSVVQACRYARTMAVLHQAETEVRLVSAGSDGGKALIEVRAVAGSGVALELGEITSARAVAKEQGEALDDGDVKTNYTASVATALDFADEVSMKHESEGVVFEFDGYTDSLDDEEGISEPDAGEEENSATRPVIELRFKSNGLCRPFRVKVMDGEDGEQYYYISVDATGRGKIEDYGEDE